MHLALAPAAPAVHALQGELHLGVLDRARLAEPLCTVVMLDRYRRTVAGVLLAVISSMNATSVLGAAGNGVVCRDRH